MSKIVSIGIPTVQETEQKEVIELLRTWLLQAEKGEISAIIMIGKRPDGHWQEKVVGDFLVTEAIGKLEVAKFSYVLKYLKAEPG